MPDSQLQLAMHWGDPFLALLCALSGLVLLGQVSAGNRARNHGQCGYPTRRGGACRNPAPGRGAGCRYHPDRWMGGKLFWVVLLLLGALATLKYQPVLRYLVPLL